MIYLYCYHLNSANKGHSKRMLLNNLSHYLGKTVNAEDIKKNTNGKPEIEGIYFSVSHSKNKLVQAFSREGSLGVDVEYKDANRKLMALAKRYFHRSESKWLESLDSKQFVTMFYNLWSRKEAVCKAQGGRLWYYLCDNYLDEMQQMIDSIKGLNLIQLDVLKGFSLVIAAEDSSDQVKIVHD